MVAIYTGIGGIFGATTSFIVGGMGLTALGTGVAIGFLPVTLAGAVCGLAYFGLKKATKKDIKVQNKDKGFFSFFRRNNTSSESQV